LILNGNRPTILNHKGQEKKEKEEKEKQKNKKAKMEEEKEDKKKDTEKDKIRTLQTLCIRFLRVQAKA
jgi:hypothetical protein